MNSRWLMATCVVFLLALIGSSSAIDLIIQGSGSADVIYDGEAQEYTLQIGFDLDTEFSNPSSAVALFSRSSFEGSANPRRIRLRVDSTKTGAIEATAGNKRFVFIQEGGQLYFPKVPCVIEIQKAYSGNPSSILKGRIESCVVRSAGIEHTISARFQITGTPNRKMMSSY